MDFGKYGATDQVQEHSFAKEPGWYWKVKVATWKEEQARDKMLSDVELVWARSEDGKPETVQRNRVPDSVVTAYEIYSTFAGSNIPSGDKDQPLFKENMDKQMFMNALNMLPAEMVYEIHKFVRETNPQWQPGWSAGEKN